MSAPSKPLMNLDEVVFDDVEEIGLYTSRRGFVGEKIGARQLGYNLTAPPPGKAQCPFHNHRAEEEMFLILEGEGELRFGARRFPLRRQDVIACPAGGPKVARQIVNTDIVNTGATDLRYLAISTLAPVEVCEQPDSGKVSIHVDRAGGSASRKIFRAETVVDCYGREDAAATEAAP